MTEMLKIFGEFAGVMWNGKRNQKPRPETQQMGLGTTKLESATWGIGRIT